MSILGNIGTKFGTELKSLSDRVTTLEGTVPAPVGGLTAETVTWTNLSEINLSGEKLVNGDFSQSGYVQDTSFCLLSTCGLQPNNGHSVNHTFAEADRPKIIALQASSSPTLTEGTIYRIKNVNTGNEAIQIENLDGTLVGWTAGGLRGNVWQVVVNAPTNWSLTNGTFDDSKLSQGIIKGDGGAVSVQQMFSNPIPSGTELVLKATRTDTNSGNVRFNPIRSSDGVAMSANIGIDPSVGYATYTTTIALSGVKLDTLHGLHEVSSVSIFQGAVSGGTVQTFTGGSIEKISGAGAYNAGASSVQKIDGQKDGYVQFQIAHATNSLKIGLVNQDHDFEVDAPWKMNFGGGRIDLSSPWIADHTPYVNGDWFRIRHYSTSNEIKFQKREDVYQVDTSAPFEIGTKILILRDFSSAVKDEVVTVYFVNSLGVPSFEQDDGTQIGAQASITGYGRTDWWEVAESLGEDYVTFYTHPTLTNGSDLYLDTVFHAVGARLNDVQIAT